MCTGKVLLWNSRACHRELPEIPKDLVQLKVVVHQFVLEVSDHSGVLVTPLPRMVPTAG